VPRYSPVSFFAIFALGILAGGLQLIWRPALRWLSDVVVLAGFLLCVWTMHALIPGGSDGYAFLGIPYGYPWFPVGAGLMLVAFPSTVLLGKLADNRVALFIARISFGLYLWHFLVLSVMGALWIPGARDGGMTDIGQWLLVGVVAIAASTAIATTSFYLFEQAIIRWARGLERSGAGRVATAA
jgi:peptidoglycan/LPS O-acetylase OafA/YrhL